MLKLFKSRTVWMFILLFVVNGIEGVRELVPAGFLPGLDAVLGLLGIYFRVKPKVSF